MHIVTLTVTQGGILHYRSLKVRLIKTSDIEQVELLCHGIDGSNHVIADIKQYLAAKRDYINEVGW